MSDNPDTQDWPTRRWPNDADVIGEVTWAARTVQRPADRQLGQPKRAYPTQGFDMTDINLLDAIVGEVVWTGRYLGSGKKADSRNMKHKRSSA